MVMVLFVLLSVTILTIIITVGIWLYFNKEKPKALDVLRIIKAISDDLSKIGKGLRLLAELVSEIAQPILSSEVVDISSEELIEDVEDK